MLYAIRTGAGNETCAAVLRFHHAVQVIKKESKSEPHTTFIITIWDKVCAFGYGGSVYLVEGCTICNNKYTPKTTDCDCHGYGKLLGPKIC